jgi:hypothetical protein
MNGKVRLGPAPLFAEFSNTLPESYADIFSCHAISMAVFFGLHFAYRIQLRSREIAVVILTFGWNLVADGGPWLIMYLCCP